VPLHRTQDERLTEALAWLPSRWEKKTSERVVRVASVEVVVTEDKDRTPKHLCLRVFAFAFGVAFAFAFVLTNRVTAFTRSSIMGCSHHRKGVVLVYAHVGGGRITCASV
jgi:hypothetical protein